MYAKKRRKRPRPHKPPKSPRAKLFAQPDPDFYTLPELEIRGGTVIAAGCHRVLDFTPEKVCLDFGRSLVTFYGRGLRIESLVGKRLILAGRPARIEFAAKWGEDAPNVDTTP